MKATGIVLLILGIGLTIFTGIKYFSREDVVDIGKVHVTADKPHYLSWSPFVGVGVIIVGGIMLWQGSKK